MQYACLVQILWFQPKYVTSYLVDKLSFLEFWAEMAKMTWKVIVNDPHFQYQPRVSQDAYFVQIWWFRPKSVMSYSVYKPSFLEFRVEMAKMTLKVKANDPYFQYQLKVFRDACLVQI